MVEILAYPKNDRFAHAFALSFMVYSNLNKRTILFNTLIIPTYEERKSNNF